MAGFSSQPRLEIELIDDTWAELRTYFEVDWNMAPRIDDFHRIAVEVWGEDKGIAGGEGFIGDRENISDGTFDTQGNDRLFEFVTSSFYQLSGRPVINVTGIERVQRIRLDEDKGWGLIKRARNRRDVDEIYVIGRMQVIQPRSSSGWRQVGSDSERSNVVKGKF